jgi:hypothetical protein
MIKCNERVGKSVAFIEKRRTQAQKNKKLKKST